MVRESLPLPTSAEFVRALQELARTGERQLIRAGGKPVAVLAPYDDSATDAVKPGRRTRRRPQDACCLAGVWSDLDWEQAADELDRIRHESRPTPPFEL